MALLVPDIQLTKPTDRLSVQGRGESGTGLYASAVRAPAGGFFMYQAPQVDDALRPWNPIFPNTRDAQLKYLSFQDSMIASGIYSMKTRMMTLKHVIKGETGPKDFSDALLASPGLGDNLQTIVAKVVDDLLTCDNGAFIEKWGPGDPSTPLDRQAVVGFGHLDSRQCWRTFDKEYPVIYTNPQTTEMHRLHTTRVVIMSDNPQPLELARGIGFSGMSRAVRWVRLMRDIMQYKTEKVSGRFTRAIGAVKGVTRQNFEEALAAQRANDRGSGFVMYSGIPFLVAPGLKAGEDIEIVLQDLASLPDGFDFADDLSLYAYVLAFVFGVDAREFWPATQSGATKGDAGVQNQKAQARGIGSVTQTVEWGINQCLPEGATLTYDVTDDEQEKLQLENADKRITVLSTAKRDGIISKREYRAHLVAHDILEREVLENPDPVEGPEAPDLEEVDPVEEAEALAIAEGRRLPPGQEGMVEEGEEEGEKRFKVLMDLPPVFRSKEEALAYLQGEYSGDAEILFD